MIGGLLLGLLRRAWPAAVIGVVLLSAWLLWQSRLAALEAADDLREELAAQTAVWQARAAAADANRIALERAAADAQERSRRAAAARAQIAAAPGDGCIGPAVRAALAGLRRAATAGDRGDSGDPADDPDLPGGSGGAES